MYIAPLIMVAAEHSIYTMSISKEKGSRMFYGAIEYTIIDYSVKSEEWETWLNGKGYW